MNEAKKTVLLVDDDEDYLLQTRSLIEAGGYAVLTAGSLAEADKTLAESKFDLVVADLMMEYPDAGFVFCHHVKKRDPKIPVILVTAVTSETGMEFENASGDERSWVKADAILTKPIRGDQLRREIGRLLKG